MRPLECFSFTARECMHYILIRARRNLFVQCKKKYTRAKPRISTFDFCLHIFEIMKKETKYKEPSIFVKKAGNGFIIVRTKIASRSSWLEFLDRSCQCHWHCKKNHKINHSNLTSNANYTSIHLLWWRMCILHCKCTVCIGWLYSRSIAGYALPIT